jgi:hypothetical protein
MKARNIEFPLQDRFFCESAQPNRPGKLTKISSGLLSPKPGNLPYCRGFCAFEVVRNTASGELATCAKRISGKIVPRGAQAFE